MMYAFETASKAFDAAEDADALLRAGKAMGILAAKTGVYGMIGLSLIHISSGGGGSHRPQKEYISFKKTDVNHLPVPGAEFTFYDQWGNEMDRAVSDEKGYF